MYRTVVVGTDGSETAGRAIAAAADLARAAGARLVVVTAFTHDDKADSETASQPGIQAEDLAKAGRDAARAAGVADVVVVTDEGPPGDVLLGVAEDHGADLVVVGSKGMTGASRFVLGSVANTVTHHGPCDVLVVHTT